MNKIKELHPLLHFIISDHKSSSVNLQNKHRNLYTFARDLTTIYEYNKNICKHFEKRIIKERDIKNFWGGTFAEIIVIAFYIREKFNVEINEGEADLIITIDNDQLYFEVLSICPDWDVTQNTKDTIVYDVKTHLPVVNTSSVRGKLCGKLGENQNQFKDGLKNIAIIELNDVSIAGDFHVLSSLSGGYKVELDKNSGKIVKGGFDWNNNSFFEREDSKRVSAIIYFSMGNYKNRKKIKNPTANCPIDNRLLKRL
ncbi:MAG TPA: hypothetical protein ACFYD2_07560 [Candidatus Avalokitesvara rifleensis]|uniref:hypothetical protein n=1 Tax=Candidatus Avalokitesvara rifleensis TaxID=3367620 RepID=UPI0027124CAB|nr:hypothetical protein [Candidatus Brocadiales bacterium]